MELIRLAFHLLAALSAPVVFIGLGACTTAPTHNALAGAAQSGQLLPPPLVPVRRFVANIDAEGGCQIARNGERLMWQQTVGLDIGLAVRDVTNPAGIKTFATGNKGRGGGHQYWLPDSRHIVCLKDPIGNKNTQLLVVGASKS